MRSQEIFIPILLSTGAIAFVESCGLLRSSPASHFDSAEGPGLPLNDRESCTCYGPNACPRYDGDETLARTTVWEASRNMVVLTQKRGAKSKSPGNRYEGSMHPIHDNGRTAFRCLGVDDEGQKRS
jgi:hypothetical protein